MISVLITLLLVPKVPQPHQRRELESLSRMFGGRELRTGELSGGLLPMVLRWAGGTVRWIEEEALRERAGVVI